MPSEKIIFDYSTPKTLQIKLAGVWLMSSGIPSISEVTSELFGHVDIVQVVFDASKISKWDSGLVAFLLNLIRECKKKNIKVDRQGLPEGACRLLDLTDKVAERIEPQESKQEPFLERVGSKVLQLKESLLSLLGFLGEITISLNRTITGKAYFRFNDFMLILQRCGADALGLVSLISVLVGVILAFIGAIQLRIFGAQIYIADIVGIAMVRVMGAVMTGIIMSGRTGASFAAELGIMQTNEEIDALKTLGVNPVEFLVVPRILALVVMLPLLTLYADFMGILGGYVISTGVLGINPVEYLNHTQSAVKLSNLWIGLIHGFVFGVIIAISGCLRGMNCERSANGVGEATTSAVVTSITSIVVATAIITFICQVLGV
ncbi:MAG: ABC transporter permease [Candidatus Omnitrophica bacterium]|jgi:phospholipid/cholesterol/gamma-HCH transport system permease protein|nr:ABC transporter permease [Candidatus Omnitrophota bacterium]